ncbi:MAG TPA: hypothetical protein VF145_02820 [Chitinophagaceae bacterium]
MKTKRLSYFTLALLLQALVAALIIYWFTLLTHSGLKQAIEQFAEHLPDALQDTTVVMVITACITALSMVFYGAARSYSLNRPFRNLCLGLILVNAIVLLWLILSLM